MSVHADLLKQAEHLVRREPRRPRQASLRRAVSAAYYALFHFLVAEASGFLIRGSHRGLRHLISRAFEHAEMKNAAKAFAGGTLRDNIGERIGTKTVPQDLKQVAHAFVSLQEARHEADYDLALTFKKREATDMVETVRRAMYSWKRVKAEPAARAFLICLLTFNRVSKR